MSRPILAATDFSPHARHAAERAAFIAHESAAPLALMHVVPGETLARLRQWLGADSAPEAQMQADVERRLQELADQLRLARQVSVEVHCAAGSATDEVLRQAEALDAQLLTLGARGSGFLRRLMLGTTAERLMRRTARPLLVVRKKPHEPYRRVMVAVDFSPWTRPALMLAREVAPRAQLVLLTAFQVPFGEKLRFAGVDAETVELYREKARTEASRALHALAATASLKPAQWQPCVVEGDASLHIVAQEQELDCDLVVLGKHGQSAAIDLLLGSVTEHVLTEGCADVLVSTASP